MIIFNKIFSNFAQNINLVGQFLSLIGTLMLFKFGLPQRLPAQGGILTWGQPSQKEKEKDKREYLLQFIGFFLTVSGSILQMLVTFNSMK